MGPLGQLGLSKHPHLTPGFYRWVGGTGEIYQLLYSELRAKFNIASKYANELISIIANICK